MALGGRGELVHHARSQASEVDARRAQLERIRIEFGEIEELHGELRQAIHLLAHVPQEFRAGGRIGVVLLEKLDEARQGEDGRAQLVRGIGDEFAPGAVEPGELCLHLVQSRGQLPDLVRVWKLPSATISAARSRRRRRREWARAANHAAARARASAMAPAIRICRLIRLTLSSTSASGDERDSTHSGLPLRAITTALSPILAPPTPSTAVPGCPEAAATPAAG